MDSKPAIKFKARVRVQGEVFILTVPKQYVDNGLLDAGTEYWFTAEEATE